MKWKHSTESRYWDMLEALPPAEMNSLGFLLGEAADHRTCTVTGRVAERFSAFVRIDGKFYESVQPLTVVEYRRVTRQDVLANVVEAVS